MKTMIIKEEFNGVGFRYHQTRDTIKPGIGKNGVFFKIRSIPDGVEAKHIEKALLQTTFLDRNLNRFELSYNELGINKYVRN